MSMATEVTNAVLRARGILRELKIRRPLELVVEAIAWHYGARVITGPLDGAEGCMIRKGAKATILIRADLDPGKRRFDMAHELGHFLLHPSLSITPCQETDFLFWATRQAIEQEADEFAVNLLLPEEMFGSKITELAQKDPAPSFTAIGRVAQEFQTSLTFTANRYVELSGYQCALVVSSNDSIEWFKAPAGFPGWFVRGQKVNPDSHAYDLLKGNNVPVGMQPVMATAWFSERKWHDVIIREDSIRLGSYNKVLSLIWIPD